MATKHPNIAASLDAFNEGLCPRATHYIFDETEVLEKKASKLQKRNKAIAILNKLNKTSKVSIIQIILQKPLSNMSNDFIELEMEKVIKDNLDTFLSITAMDKDEIFTRATIMEAIFKGVLSKEGAAIKFMGDRIGIDMNDTVLYLSKEKNSEIKARILSNLNTLDS